MNGSSTWLEWFLLALAFAVLAGVGLRGWARLLIER